MVIAGVAEANFNADPNLPCHVARQTTVRIEDLSPGRVFAQ